MQEKHMPSKEHEVKIGAGTRSRKPYEYPKLTKWGSLTQLTRTGNQGLQDSEGGSTPETF